MSSLSLRSLIYGDSAETPSQETASSLPVDGEMPASSVPLSQAGGPPSGQKKQSSKKKKNRKSVKRKSTENRRASAHQLRRSILRGRDMEVASDASESSEDDETRPKRIRLNDPEEEARRLDIIYSSAAQNTMAVTTNEIQASLNPVIKARGRRKPELSQVQKAKQQRYREWLDIRTRWKRRECDLRNEPDVGGAVEHALRMAPLPRRTARTSKAAGETPVPPEELEPEETTEPPVDTSDEEDQNILSQLMQGSQEQQKEKEIEKKKQKKVDDFFTPYDERLDYWERGLPCPEADPEVDAYYSRLKQIIPQERRSPHKPVDEPGEYITLRTLTKHKDTLLKNAPRSYLNLTHDVPVRQYFIHERQLVRLIARKLVTSPACPDCYRILWHNTSSSAVAPRRRYAEMQRLRMRLQGQDARTFWSHTWTNRQAAADLLGMTHSYTRIDILLNPARQGEGHRRLVASKYAKRKENGTVEKVHYDMTTPSCGYVPVSGAVPPVPPRPLDIAPIVMGPIDKASTHIFNTQAIDEATYRLTVASLHRRWLKYPSTRHHLEAVADKMLELVEDPPGAYDRAKSKDNQRPLRYLVFMGYVSLTLNGGLQHQDEKANVDEDAGDYSQEAQQEIIPAEERIDPDFPSLCKRLFDYLNGGLEQSGLARMCQLYCTLGLLRIAKDLPESAARLLSRPLDDSVFRTPFDQVAGVLQHLEDNGLMVDDRQKQRSQSPVVGVGEVEYALHQASEKFAACVERDPTELQYRCWYLASLAGCLLLCSGHFMGSGARVYPAPTDGESSQELERSFNLIHSPGNEKRTDMQPASRFMLSNFPVLRQETAKAFYVLCHFASKQGNLSPRAHLAISSFLEWRQVIALLLGPDTNPAEMSVVRSFHEYHVTQWARQDIASAKVFMQNQRDNAKSAVEFYAAAVEVDPSSIQNWRALAEELGSVGCQKVSQEEHQSKCPSDCRGCGSVVPGHYVDHDEERARTTGSKKWWGRERQISWSYSILDLGSIPPIPFQLHESSGVCKEVEVQLKSLQVHPPRPRCYDNGDGGVDESHQPKLSALKNGFVLLMTSYPRHSTR